MITDTTMIWEVKLCRRGFNHPLDKDLPDELWVKAESIEHAIERTKEYLGEKYFSTYSVKRVHEPFII